jgi:23S rRNA pseudouridine2605 synthase
MSSPRLQKWLSTLGVASRREAERLILAGRIQINGKVVTELGTKVDPAADEVRLDGEVVSQTAPKKLYYLLCKPDGVITTRNDPQGRNTVFDLPTVRALGKGLFSVGRLDLHTEGLMILSNDGELVNRLMHPKWKLPRHYYILIDDRLSPTQETKLRTGMPLDDGPSAPVELEFLDKKKGKGAWYRITVHEGRNRLVRRLFEACNARVRRLIRYGFGSVRLPEDLVPGSVRPLLREELLHLLKATDLLDRKD